jgi:hypothetical protein
MHLLDHPRQFCSFSLQRGITNRVVTISQGTSGEILPVLVIAGSVGSTYSCCIDQPSPYNFTHYCQV